MDIHHTHPARLVILALLFGGSACVDASDLNRADEGVPTAAIITQKLQTSLVTNQIQQPWVLSGTVVSVSLVEAPFHRLEIAGGQRSEALRLEGCTDITAGLRYELDVGDEIATLLIGGDLFRGLSVRARDPANPQVVDNLRSSPVTWIPTALGAELAVAVVAIEGTDEHVALGLPAERGPSGDYTYHTVISGRDCVGPQVESKTGPLPDLSDIQFLDPATVAPYARCAPLFDESLDPQPIEDR